MISITDIFQNSVSEKKCGVAQLLSVCIYITLIFKMILLNYKRCHFLKIKSKKWSHNKSSANTSVGVSSLDDKCLTLYLLFYIYINLRLWVNDISRDTCALSTTKCIDILTFWTEQLQWKLHTIVYESLYVSLCTLLYMWHFQDDSLSTT